MQLNNLEQVESVASKVNFSIFELPKDTDLSLIFSKSIHIVPEGDKTKHISIEQIRSITQIASNKQTSDIFIVIEQPETMSPNATNAFLKSLEEPGTNTHFVFLCHESSLLLPTVRSRANNYYLADNTKINDPPKANPEALSLAKAYISCTPSNIADIVEKITKFHKDDARNGALEILNAGIELMYKSYLITGNKSFAVKLEKLLKAQDAISQNGHLKLQLIANML